MESMDLILIETFQRLILQVFGQLFIDVDVEQCKEPLVQHQLVGEWHLRPIVSLTYHVFQLCPAAIAWATFVMAVSNLAVLVADVFQNFSNSTWRPRLLRKNEE